MEGTEQEQKKETLANSDLRVIMEGTDRVVFIKDKLGKDHRILPLSIHDLIEFEDEIGTSIFNIMNANLGMKQIFSLLYFSLRKEGLSEQDIEAKKWKYTRSQLGNMFDLRLLTSAIGLFNDLLDISGLSRRPRTAEPNQDNIEKSAKDSTKEEDKAK